MDINQRKEQISKALVHAVATAAGFKIQKCEVDDESVDVTIAESAALGTIRGVRLDIQLKCTERDLLKDDGLHLPLKRKNYDDLRATDWMIPKILVVMTVPSNVKDWLSWKKEDSYTMMRYAWWMSLLGADDKAGIETPTVILPRANHFTPESLTLIMERISNNQAI